MGFGPYYGDRDGVANLVKKERASRRNDDGVSRPSVYQNLDTDDGERLGYTKCFSTTPKERAAKYK